MLSDGVVTVEPYEEQIRARLEATIVTLHDKSAVSRSHILPVICSSTMKTLSSAWRGWIAHLLIGRQ